MMGGSSIRVATVVVATSLAVAACSGQGAKQSPRSFGHDGDQIVVTPASSAHARIGRAAARRILDHPFNHPVVVNASVVYEGYGVVHVGATDDAAGTASGMDHAMVFASSLDGHQVWIRVSKGLIGQHSCPAQLPVPPGKVRVEPPPAQPIAFAVMVDAQTGDEADWSESSTTPLCPVLRDR